MTENIIELLRREYLKIDEGLGSTFNRSLSLQDAIFNRWERAERLGFGKGANIYNSASVFGDVSVGENTWVGPSVILDGSGGSLKI